MRSFRCRRLFATLLLTALGAALPAVRAHAGGSVDWQGAATVGIGVTDNVANTPTPPDDAPKGTPRPEWDGFGNVSPALQLIIETKRTVSTLAYAIGYRFYFTHPEANALSNSFSYGLSAEVSRTATFTLGLLLAETQLSVFNQVGGAAQSPALAAGSGDAYVFSATALQGVHVELSKRDTFDQALSFTANDNVQISHDDAVKAASPTQTYLGSLALTLTHEFRRDSLGATVGSDIADLPDQSPKAPPGTHRTDLIHRAFATYHHDFSPSWSTTLTAGATVAYDASDLHVFAQPTGSASLDYGTERGVFGVSYAHAVGPNLLLQELTLTDTATVRGGVPLGVSGFDLSGTGSFYATRATIPSGGYTAPGYGILADAAVGYVPGKAPLRLELRYQFAKQFAATTTTGNAAPVPDVQRNTVLFSLTYFFPHRPGRAQAGPGVVPLPAPTSDPSLLHQSTPTPTRAGSDDAERRDRSDKIKKSGGESGQ